MLKCFLAHKIQYKTFFTQNVKSGEEAGETCHCIDFPRKSKYDRYIE